MEVFQGTVRRVEYTAWEDVQDGWYVGAVVDQRIGITLEE